MRHHREPQVRPGLPLPSSSHPLVVCARATIVCICTYVISSLLIPSIQSPRKDGGDAMVWSKPGRRVATHSPPRSASRPHHSPFGFWLRNVCIHAHFISLSQGARRHTICIHTAVAWLFGSAHPLRQCTVLTPPSLPSPPCSAHTGRTHTVHRL